MKGARWPKRYISNLGQKANEIKMTAGQLTIVALQGYWEAEMGEERKSAVIPDNSDYDQMKRKGIINNSRNIRLRRDFPHPKQF